MGMSSLEALDIIKDIGLSHMAYDSDENYDGEWEYEAVEVDDGTIEDNCPEEVEIIEKSLKAFEIVKDWFEVVEDENGYHIKTTFRALFDNKKIDKETFDVLKKVLAND